MKTFVFLLLLLITLILCQCNPDPVRYAIRTSDPQIGIDIVKSIGVADDLKRIVLKARNEEVRISALNKLNDQEIIREIINLLCNSRDTDLAVKALSKLSDQEKLAGIVLNNDIDVVWSSALEKITDQSIIKGLFLKNDKTDVNSGYSGTKQNNISDYHTRIRSILNKLTDFNLLSEILYTKDLHYLQYFAIARLQSLYNSMSGENKKLLKNTRSNVYWRTTEKLLRAFDNAGPSEDADRNLHKVFPAVAFLMLPEVFEEVGEIKSIRVSWKAVSAHYRGDFSGNKPGERLTCAIRTEKLPYEISSNWATTYPEVVSDLSFKEAEVSYKDMLDPLVSKSSIKVKNAYETFVPE
jgi:hypothetical protein